MYIPELGIYSKYGHIKEKEPSNTVAVGWLDSEHSYNTGDVSREFLKCLEVFCSEPLIQAFGVEMCPLCEDVVIVELTSGTKIQLHGIDEIRIPSKTENKVYAASDFILHYVLDHRYKPPQEFIDAVLAAPLPGTSEYEEFIKPWEKYY